MKRLLSTISLLLFNYYIVAQQIDNKVKINVILNEFMNCIETKDSLKMYNLFQKAPITWVGVYQEKTQRERLKKDSAAVNYKISDYKTWFRNVCKPSPRREDFHNIEIMEDGSIASVTFDYSFWVNNKKGNWGKEFWHLINENGVWKIASVIFSIENESLSPQPINADSNEEVKNTKIEDYIKQFKDTTNFQGTVLIAKGDSIIHHAAYGYFNMENKIPNKTNTQYLIGSLTKSFVATSIMQLVEKGLVDLNAPIQQYLPKMNAELAKGITVHHLLKHQSGLAVFIDDLTTVEVMDITPAEMLDIINKSKKSFKAGEKHQYSNINYTLLSMIIEQVSGKPYQTYLQENIFQPAGMTDSGLERLLNIPTNRAFGYRKVNQQVRRIQNVVSYALGSGDIYATAFDIYKWGKALHGGKLVNANSLSKMFDGGTKDWGYYGYGFRTQQYQRSPNETKVGTLIRHGGTMNGFITNYHYYKEDDLTVIILSNYRNIPIRTMSYHLKEIVLDSEAGKRKNIMFE